MKLYNSLTKKVDTFEPLNPSVVSVYSCGPTVYERAHIGNLASFIYADMLRRALALTFPDAKIKHVMNVTDVDDKTIKRSQEEYPDLEPKEALNKLTRHYEDLFMQDLKVVGVDVSKITFIRATESVSKMQELIRKLVEAGIAYVAGDGVYFSIKNYKAAGKIYGQLVEITAESTGAARVNNDEYDKDAVHDFALWKKQKSGEPAWDFEIGAHDLKGRPGWHIECSAMSVQELGQPFDIHTGGIDLKFPHHENEIAQSTAAIDEKLLAKLFFHNEHMLIDGQKMSKSLNNFYTLEDIKIRGFDPLAFRLLVLQAHYRSQAHFSWKNLQAAQNRLSDIRAWADRRHQTSIDNMPEELDNRWRDMFKDLGVDFANDIDGPAALVNIGKLMSYMETHPIPSHDGQHTDGALAKLDDIFGLQLDKRPDISDEQKRLISERETARLSKDFAKSDELRKQLEEQGIGLNDTPYGPIWFWL